MCVLECCSAVRPFIADIRFTQRRGHYEGFSRLKHKYRIFQRSKIGFKQNLDLLLKNNKEDFKLTEHDTNFNTNFSGKGHFVNFALCTVWVAIAEHKFGTSAITMKNL